MNKFNFKCPICGKTTRNTNIVRTIMGGRMCINCYLRTQDDSVYIKRREYVSNMKIGETKILEA